MSSGALGGREIEGWVLGPRRGVGLDTTVAEINVSNRT
jgi:hypothetical protein